MSEAYEVLLLFLWVTANTAGVTTFFINSLTPNFPVFSTLLREFTQLQKVQLILFY